MVGKNHQQANPEMWLCCVHADSLMAYIALENLSIAGTDQGVIF